MFPNLDTITRSVLMQRGYPLHWYVQFLKYAADGLRELKFDSLPTIQSKLVDVSETGSIAFPKGFIDVVSVDHAHGQFTRSMVRRDDINPLMNLDNNGKIINYPEMGNRFTEIWFGYARELGGTREGFDVSWTRREIQLTQGGRATKVLLKFIDDGSCTNNATEIHPYAQATLEQYMKWQYKENTRSYSGSERQEEERRFYNQLRILRGRIDPLSCADVINIFNRASGTLRG